jgi:glycosyltransferase involved in cell wall biosynthesis
VEHGVTGFVAEPSPEALGAAISRLAGEPALARSLGDAGYDRVRSITWDGVVDRLMAES